ncbi:MAG: hypothetical protein FWD99_06315 [Oscillospiraceae bacterium]|nr:hypothetical protein [Oscillospiraceae bacterium]
MNAKVRFKNKISEPLMDATDFCIQTKAMPDKTVYSLEFKVCYSEGVVKTYSFDSHDEKLIQDLFDRIAAKGEFLFDTACKACAQTIKCTELDYDMYLALTQSGEIEGDLKFAGGDYVVTV